MLRPVPSEQISAPYSSPCCGNSPEKQKQIAELKEAFDKFDEQFSGKKTGTLSKWGLQALFKEAGTDFDAETLGGMMQDFDSDGDKRLDFGEFLGFMVGKELIESPYE